MKDDMQKPSKSSFNVALSQPRIFLHVVNYSSYTLFNVPYYSSNLILFKMFDTIKILRVFSLEDQWFQLCIYDRVF